jgi:hypothetical protein
MQHINQIGELSWGYSEMRDAIAEFMELYSNRPVSLNDGGMKTPHMFATWFMLKKLKPEIVIESGVWKGQGTWLIEQALPDAKLYCIDLNLGYREFISESATYFEQDFEIIDWSFIESKDRALLFFDDHQNALNRIRKGKILGFKHFIFEDNYPALQGDCYSLKKAFQHAGFTPQKIENIGLKQKIKSFFGNNSMNDIEPNPDDANFLNDALDVYYEFPPLFKRELTRWNDKWDDENYPTPDPLFKNDSKVLYPLLFEEAIYYTWICYCKLK